jgi:hypothetical protein
MFIMRTMVGELPHHINMPQLDAYSLTVRLEMQLKSGIAMAAPMMRAMEVMNPSV